MKRLAVLGASGHGKIIADAAQLQGWAEVVFFDDAWPKLQLNSHWQVVGDTAALLLSVSEFDGVIVAIGNNQIRLAKTEQLEAVGAALTTVVHPSATVSSYAKVGAGSFIGAGAVVQVDAVIGKAVIVNTQAIIEHDCVLADAVHVSPNAALAGGVTVGECSWVGAGSVVKQLIAIAEDVVVGAGAVVVKDVPAGVTVVGSPARVLER